MKRFDKESQTVQMVATLIGCQPASGLVNALNDLRSDGQINNSMTFGQIVEVWLMSRIAYQFELRRTS